MFEPGPIQRLHFPRRLRNYTRKLAESLSASTRGEVVDLVHRIRLLMQRDHRFSDEVNRDDVDPVGGAERQERQSSKKDERADHIELRGFSAAAVAQDDAWTEDHTRYFGEQFAHHMLAELLCARIGIV